METRYLISIGINDYDDHPLLYCCNDSRELCSCFNNFCQVKKENIFRIISETEQPNADVEKTFYRVVEKIAAKFIKGEDSIFFHFSGHGQKSENSTTLLFHHSSMALSTVFAKLRSLGPKFIFCLIDSCYSGVGIDDGIDRSVVSFSQEVQVASGYSIICASAPDASAKEDPHTHHGRLTRLFLDIVHNRFNYRLGTLSVNSIYQLVDVAFKNNPSFRQFPFTQTRGVSTYPLALLDARNEAIHFSTHYIDTVESFDWSVVKLDLKQYCGLRDELVNEFTRLVREIFRNSVTWGGAKFLKMEIRSGQVSLIDNSGSFFDIFNPPADVEIDGGGMTAKIFLENFKQEFSFSGASNGEETLYVFEFIQVEKADRSCAWEVDDIAQLRRFQMGVEFEIPENCHDYTIIVPQGEIDLSSVYMFLESIVAVSQSTDKPVTIEIHKLDRLKDEFVYRLQLLERRLGAHKVKIV